MNGRIVTFGEVMLRLKSPGHERLLQSPVLETSFGGGEANVAVSLAQFGLESAFVTALPANALGDACVQFLRGSHQQDMDGWPNYWPGLPPMWYATHCVGPVCALTNATAEYVSCFGSGTIRKELVAKYNSPFAVETTHIKFKDSDLSARIYRSLFDVARQYRESFDVYGSKASIEWPLIPLTRAAR